MSYGIELRDDSGNLFLGPDLVIYKLLSVSSYSIAANSGNVNLTTPGLTTTSETSIFTKYSVGLSQRASGFYDIEPLLISKNNGSITIRNYSQAAATIEIYVVKK